MACVNRSNSNNFLRWNKVVGNLTLAELQANGMPEYCDNVNMSAPQNLIATSISTTEIDLDWDVADVTPDNILVYRSTDGVTYALIATFAGSLISYSDTGLTNGTLYYYKIKATGDVDSAYSNVATTSTALDYKTVLRSDGVGDLFIINSAIQGTAYTDEMTWAWYFKMDGAVNTGGGGDVIFEDIDTLGTSYFQLRIDMAAGYARGFVYHGSASGTGSFGLGSGTIGQKTGWHRIVLTREVDTLDPTLYRFIYWLDGVEAPSFTAIKDLFPTVYGNDQQTFFARKGGVSSLEAAIDEFIILNEKVTNADALLDYNDGLGSNHLAANFTTKIHYKFDEADDDINGGGGGGDNTAIASPQIVDSSGNGYTGAMTAFTKTGTTSNWIDHV